MTGADSGPRAVASGRGAEWLVEGWALFKMAPGTWIGVLVLWFVLMLVIGFLPLGELASFFLNIIFGAGMMLGCASLASGHGLKIEHLFSGFRDGKLGALLLLGLLEFVFVLILVLAAAAILAIFFGMAFLSSPESAEPMALLVGVLLVMALFVPLAMATWFAPARVVLGGDPPWPAMKNSFSACQSNIGPFLVYGILAMLLLVVASIPLGLGLLVALPMMVASIYASFRDLWPLADPESPAQNARM